MLYLDWTLTLSDNDLPKVKTACDLAGVAVHFPMLDPQVVRVSALIPSREKLSFRQLRRFYKRAFAHFLPPEVIGKSKHGFGVPVGIWINGDPMLRERVRARLDSLGRRGIVRREFIDNLLRLLLRLQQTDDAGYYGAMTWSLFMLEEWLLAHPPDRGGGNLVLRRYPSD
jgi:asparagine synthase (glutamine-hydrolysing)